MIPADTRGRMDAETECDKQLRTWRRKRMVAKYTAALLSIGIVTGSVAQIGGLHLGKYQSAAVTAKVLLCGASPPDFARWPFWARPLLDTVFMGVAGTSVGVAVSIPLGLLGARTLCPLAITVPVRLLLNSLRTIPSLVWGILFVAGFGFGSLAGALALTVHSIGMLGKFFSELVEHVDHAPIQALTSEGVGRLGIVRFGILPQVTPRMADVALYRFEHNIREASTLGSVGAGGIGLEIVAAFHLFEYREAAALLIVTLLLVTALDALSAFVRRAFLGT